MSGISDKATVTLVVNGEQAKQTMTNFEASIKRTESVISTMKAKLADPAAFNKAKADVDNYQSRLDSVMAVASQTKESIRKMKAASADPRDIADAQSQLKKYSSEIGALRRSLKSAKDELKLFDPKELERQKHNLKNYKKQLDEMRSATEGVNRAFKSLDMATPRQLERSIKTLDKQLKGLKPNTEAWHEAKTKIQQFRAQLDALKKDIRGQETIWSRFSKWWYDSGQAVAALIAGYKKLVSTLRGYVNDYAELEEAIADTRKFTGIAEEGVRRLNEEFKKIDTRTPLEKLHSFAQEAGRLGKNTEGEVLGYVKAADITNVALSELGDDATETIAKVANIFDVEAEYGTEQAILKVGSTVNDLAQNCSATSNYIVEFSKRLAGVGAQAKMSVPEIMAFGAVLDANGQNVEMAATALSQTIMKLFQKPAEIARTVGMEVETFTETLKRNTTEGLMMFLDAIGKMGGDNALATLSPLFKDLGLDGARMSTVLSVLAGKIDMVKDKIREANAAFVEGKSTTEEFSVFNNTVQAQLDKAKERLHQLSAELGGKLMPVMSHFMSTSSAAMKAINILVDFFIEYKREIVTLTSAIALYKIAISAATIETKLHTAAVYLNNKAIQLWRAGVLLASAAHGLLTGNLVKARKAMILFNAVMRTTPLGIVLAVLTTVTLALVHFTKKTDEAAKAQKQLAQAERDAAADAKKELSETQYLYDKTQDVTSAMEKRLDAAKKLQQLHPETFSNLSAEAIVAGEAADAYQRLADNILAASRAKAYQGKVDENTESIVEKESRRDSIIQGMINEGGFDSTVNAILRDSKTDNKQKVAALYKHYEYQESSHAGVNSYNPGGDWNDKLIRSEILSKRLKNLQDDIDALEKRNESLQDKIYDLKRSNTPSTQFPEEPADGTDDGVDVGGGYTSVKLAGKEAKRKALEEKRALAKANAEYRDRMEGAKGDWEAAKADNVVNYSQGLISYEEYIAEKERIDLKYIEDRINIYNDLYKDESAENKKLLLKYDEDYQELLLKKAEMEKKHADAASKRKVQDLQREYKKELDAWNLMFNNPDSDWYGDSFAQQEKLHELKIEYLTKYRDAYKENSQEWVQYQQQIEDAEAAHILNHRKMYVQELESWRKRYSEQSLEQRRKMELAVVQALLDANLISLDEYKKKVEQITKAFTSAKDTVDKQEPPTEKSWFAKIGIGAGHSQRAADFEQQQAELARQLDDGEIKAEEYLKKLQEAKEKLFAASMQKFASSLDPIGQSALGLAATFADVFKSISENGKISFENIADIAAATFGTMSAGLAMYGQFAEAQSKIEIANVERKYDREIEAMQGNTYKTAKLEKKKEAEVAKLKAEATKKEFNIKVAQAVANTAQSAILGYMAGLQAGFPMALWLAPTLAGLATATGMVQLALIKKQQKAAEAEGYAEGGFTKPGAKYEPAGIVHAGEWVASQELLANPVARPLIDQLDYVQRTNTIGSLKSEDVSRAITAPQSLSRIMEGDASSALIVAAIAQSSSVVERLADRLDKPIAAITTVAGDHGINQAQDEYDALLRNVTPKSKQK